MNFPFYSTSYGEQHGYNSRRSLNNSEFRNRYLNPVYNGSLEGNSNRPGMNENHACPSGPSPRGPSQQMPPGTGSYGARGPPPQMRRPQTVPGNAGSQIMAQTQPMSARPTQPAQPGYDGYQPKSYNIVPYRPRTPPLRQPGLTQDNVDAQQNFGKYSVSRKLPDRERLRYHLPGYMGFVKNIQYLHGDTYGRTTRKCILSPGVAEH